jgi:uncharacterized protein YqgV (UPF0045/DUF77 family)
VENLNARGVEVGLDNRLAAETRLVGSSEAGFMIVRKLARMASHRSKRIRISMRIETRDGPELCVVVSGTGIRKDCLNRSEIED